jgi:hypothetical protein
VDQFRAEIKANNRLRWAIYVARDLNIDDPVLWMNHAGPVLDMWIAYHLVENEESKKSERQKVSPAEFFDRIEGMA